MRLVSRIPPPQEGAPVRKPTDGPVCLKIVARAVGPVPWIRHPVRGGSLRRRQPDGRPGPRPGRRWSQGDLELARQRFCGDKKAVGYAPWGHGCWQRDPRGGRNRVAEGRGRNGGEVRAERDLIATPSPLCTSVCPRLPSRACARPERPRGGVARMGARGTAAATGLLGECLDLRRWRARAGASGSRQEILPVGIGNTGGRDRRSGARKDPPDRPVRVSRQALRRPGSRPLRADDPDPGAPVATRRGRPLLRPVAEAAA